MASPSGLNVQIERVFPHHLERYNTTNYPRETPGVPADIRVEAFAKDYETEHQKTNLSAYLPLTRVEWTYEFTPAEARTLLEYTEIGRMTGRIPNSRNPDYEHREDLNSIARRMQGICEKRILAEKWFFRFAASSPKDGTCGEDPITGSDGIKNIFRRIITSKRAYSALSAGNRTLYFTKFREDWSPEKEFRVFVRGSQVTAISQYSTRHAHWASYGNLELMAMGREIVRFCDEILARLAEIPAMQEVHDMTIDVIIVRNEIELIEINSFGYWQAAGSCLFDWLDDLDKLYGSGRDCSPGTRVIYFRVSAGENATVDPYTLAKIRAGL